MVRNQQLLGQAALRDVLHQSPGGARKLDCYPLLNQEPRQHFGPKYVVFRQLGNLLEVLHAQPQIVELPARKIKQSQGKFGRQNLVIHYVVVHQLKPGRCKRCQRGTRAAVCRLRCLPSAGNGYQPVRAARLKRQQGVTPVLHVPGVARRIDQLQ